ncbi:MAG: hypothetical protein FWH00_00885, partial [Oscillospiraceae bacterium]|nr:hypothetical protein [Oscillospiraceae bacterium]
MEQRENFYILLELSFDPPVNDPAEIKAAIAAKRQQWTRLQDTPGRRTVALSYLEMIPEIESVMADASRRQNECEQAKKMQRETLGRYEAELRVLESKDYITPREFTNIQVKYKPFGITKELAESYIKVPVSEEPPEQRADETGEILDRIAAKSIRRNLQVVGNTDLYDFLGEAPYSSIKKLTDASEAKRREAAQSTAKNARTAAAQELAGMCLGLFENFDTKQKYDRYLKISAYPDLADLIDEESNRSGFISPDVLLRLCNYGMETSEGTVLAFEQFIRRYCAAYDIPVTNTGRQISCPACSAKASRSDTVCASCAAPLAGSCPACGTGFEAGAGICTICGFSLSQMVKALSYIDEAENALIDSNWSSAQRGIQYARKYWPGHQKLQALDRRAKHLEERYASYVENIADCIKYRQYY